MSLKNSLIVLWVYIMYVLGVWIFSSGYLLKRIVVHKNNSAIVRFGGDIVCQNLTSLQTITYDFIKLNNYTGQLYPRSSIHKFDKAVIIIIDALRYDFVFPNNSPSQLEKFYKNKLPIFQATVEKYPHQAMLFKLLADPPTTTMQRLKGLTTGSLPTFVDIGSNFASSEIFEDNIIRQMKSQGKNVVFIGDDTWEGIFPNYFHRSFSFPSFNTKDLDTVDNGILEHIYEEMDKPDSDIIIAHFLGVDHCGHRYGPQHPEMTRKLSQMNTVIKKVVQKLSKETVLFVLGDHGMTEEGDHGGDSLLEISTALFVYSSSKWLSTLNVGNQLSIAQIDIVPTLSLLLGLPIPFSNLGAVIPKMFSLNSNSTCFGDELDPVISAALALAENANQVNQYLQACSMISDDLPQSLITFSEDELRKIFLLWSNITSDSTETMNILTTICTRYHQYLLHVKKECEKVWATFCLKSIGLGFLILCISVTINLLLTDHVGYKMLLKIAASSVTFFCLFTLFQSISFLICAPVTLFVLLFLKNYLISFLCDILISIYKAANIWTVIAVIFFFASFSNSFIIYEDITVMYLLQSVLLYRFFPSIVLCFQNNKSGNTSGKDKSKNHSKSIYRRFTMPLLLLCLMTIIRTQPLFKKCREEQILCENSDFLTTLVNLHDTFSSSYQLMRLALSLSSVLLPFIAFVGLMNFRMSQKSYTVAMICVKYGITFVCVCICLRWWLNIVPDDVIKRILKGNEVILTRAALTTSLVMLFITFLLPILPERPWETPSKEVYSGSLGLLAFTISQPLYLTAGDGMAMTIMFMILCIAMHLVLIEISTDVSESYELVDIFIWSLLTRHWFYGTGHQLTFPSIQWDAAFLIDHKDVSNYVVSAIFVLMNTFSSYILHGVALPFLLVWSKSSMYSTRGVLRFQLNYLLFFGVKLLGTVGACIILRRHLMTWAIFTPKFIYEVAGMLVTMLSMIISYCFMCRVTSCYHKLIKSNFHHIFSSDEKES